MHKRIEQILLKRLTQIIQVWCTEFDRMDHAIPDGITLGKRPTSVWRTRGPRTRRVQQLKDYVAKWLQLQSLWDLEAVVRVQPSPGSLAIRQRFLTEIRKARSTFDTSETQKSIVMKEMHASIPKARNNLEMAGGPRF